MEPKTLPKFYTSGSLQIWHCILSLGLSPKLGASPTDTHFPEIVIQ